MVTIKAPHWESIPQGMAAAAWYWAACAADIDPGIVEFAIAEFPSEWQEEDDPRVIRYRDFLSQLTNAVKGGAVLGLQQAAPLTSKDQIVWATPGQPIPAGAFIAWALREGWTLPEPLQAQREPVARGRLEKKYIGIVPNIVSIFSNQSDPRKWTECRDSLKEAAHLPYPGERGGWDEYRLILWLREGGNI